MTKKIKLKYKKNKKIKVRRGYIEITKVLEEVYLDELFSSKDPNHADIFLKVKAVKKLSGKKKVKEELKLTFIIEITGTPEIDDINRVVNIDYLNKVCLKPEGIIIPIVHHSGGVHVYLMKLARSSKYKVELVNCSSSGVLDIENIIKNAFS